MSINQSLEEQYPLRPSNAAARETHLCSSLLRLARLERKQRKNIWKAALLGRAGARWLQVRMHDGSDLRRVHK